MALPRTASLQLLEPAAQRQDGVSTVSCSSQLTKSPTASRQLPLDSQDCSMHFGRTRGAALDSQDRSRQLGPTRGAALDSRGAALDSPNF